MGNVSFQQSPWLGVVLGAGFSIDGLGFDAGHLKRKNSSIIHEGAFFMGEIGLQQRFDEWQLQQTFSFGESVWNEYTGINRQGRAGRLSEDVTNHAKVGGNFRVTQTFFDFMLVGSELSLQSGKVDLNGKGYDEYNRATVSVLAGVTF